MSLSPKDINFLLNLLNEDTCGSLLTFEQISIQFQHEISKTDYFRVGNAFVLLLQNQDLIPTIQQRLIIYYLFVVMYQTIDNNPFATIFLSILQPNNQNFQNKQKYFHWIINPITKYERLFIHLLLNNSKDLVKKTPNEFLQLNLNINDKEEQDKLKEIVLEQTKQYPVLVQCHLPAIIDDPDINHVCE